MKRQQPALLNMVKVGCSTLLSSILRRDDGKIEGLMLLEWRRTSHMDFSVVMIGNPTACTAGVR